MKKHLFVFVSVLVLLLSGTTNGHTQAEDRSFTIVTSADTADFPVLKVTIQMNNKIQPLETDFKVFDFDSSPIEQITLRASAGEDTPTTGNLIFFLIDASAYTEGIPLENFKKAVIESIEDFVTEGDLINVGFFNKQQEDSRVLRRLDADFNRNFSQIKDRIRTRITTSLEDSTAKNYAFKAIKEALQVMGDSPDEGRRVLIVLSGASDNLDRSFTSDVLIDLATNAEISIHTINFKIDNSFKPDIFETLSIKTRGKSEIVNNFSGIKKVIGDILESREEAETPILQQYELVFTVQAPADGQPSQYTINYKDEPPLIVNYTTPGNGVTAPSGGFLKDYFWWIMVLIAVTLLGIAYWYMNEMKIRREEEEEARLEEEERMEEERRRLQAEKEKAVRELNEKNIRLEEQLRAKEQELARKAEEMKNIPPPPTTVTPQKRDLKHTIISGGGAAPVLKVIAGGTNQNFMLNKPVMNIGRAPNNDIVIPEQTVSGKHATIHVQKGSFFLTDLGSTNGTFVNGSRIENHLLKSGDLIKFGAAQCKFEI